MRRLNESLPRPHGLPLPVGIDAEQRGAVEIIGHYKTDPHHYAEEFAGSARLNAMDLTLEVGARADRHLAGRVAFLAAPAGEKNYFHWMIDAVARGGIVGPLSDYDHIVLNDLAKPFQRSTVELLGGLPFSFIKQGETISADSLVVPTLRRAGHNQPARWMVKFLRDRFLCHAAAHKTPSRIFISRKKRGLRDIINYDEVWGALRAEGFAELFLEDYSVSEQIALLAGADKIVAPHGAGLTNTAFCRPGAHVIEMFAPEFIGGLFYFISSYAGTRHSFVIGREVTDAPGANANSKGMLINIDDLHAALARTQHDPIAARKADQHKDVV